MRYKIGDKVKIKQNNSYHPDAQKMLAEVDHIMTIKTVLSANYIMETNNIYNRWADDAIEDMNKKGKKKKKIIPPEPINNRFEILDL